MSKIIKQIPKEFLICDYCGKEYESKDRGSFSANVSINCDIEAEYGDFALFGDMCKDCARETGYIILDAIKKTGIQERYEVNEKTIEYHKKILNK